MGSLERGTKRQCLYCGTKFYDLNREPILCPNCGKVFVQNAVKVPVRPVPEGKPVVVVEVDTAAVEAGAEVISLDDAEVEEAEEDIPDVEDVEVDDELGGDDDVFLEEDEEEDDIDFNVKDDEDDV
ncbi:MAG: TIGR02300 family protein [Alphaproteobacteria bacterium]|nr:TIGR02300 family protein [Alphaproteobacteria bacterium]